MGNVTPAERKDYHEAVAMQQMISAIGKLEASTAATRAALATGEPIAMCDAIRALVQTANQCLHGLSHAAGALSVLEDGHDE